MVERPIDSDSHVLEPSTLWLDHMPAKFHKFVTFPEDRKLNMVGDAEALAKVHGLPIEEDRFASVAAQDFSPTAYIEALDVEGVYAVVLYPTLGLSLMGWKTDDTELTTGIASVYNDWIGAFVAEYPDRLFGVGMIDMRDPQSAAKEAKRCVEQLGLVGIFVRPNPVMDRPWYDPAYDVVWNQLQALDTPVCFHDGGVVQLPQVGPDRFEKHGLWHICNHPIEQQIAMVAMVVGGVLERYPRLRVGFMEAGSGWLPYWMWRMDEQWERDAIADDLILTMPPSKYVERQGWVVADTDEKTAILALDHLGGKHVLWGSDFPHPDSVYPNAYKTLSGLPGMDRYATQVLYDNPQELYNATFKKAFTKR